ncbi:VanZ family protein [Rubrivirga sp.]|uniref:VanZ family protein n=1 Tax=Rubrivirga sp. TaxID=1885344 RepID=UPI003C751D88
MTARRLAILWSVAIVVACLVPGQGLPSVQIVSFDKLIHVLLFVGFGLLWMRAAPGVPGRILLTGVVFGIAIEVAQGTLPVHRSADVFDAIADAIGVVIGVGVGRWLFASDSAT